MHSVLLTFAAPDDDKEETKYHWQLLLQDISAIAKKGTGIEMLSENVLVLSLRGGLTSMAKIVCRLDEASRPYSVLFFDEKPNWITS